MPLPLILLGAAGGLAAALLAPRKPLVPVSTTSSVTPPADEPTTPGVEDAATCPGASGSLAAANAPARRSSLLPPHGAPSGRGSQEGAEPPGRPTLSPTISALRVRAAARVFRRAVVTAWRAARRALPRLMRWLRVTLADPVARARVRGVLHRLLPRLRSSSPFAQVLSFMFFLLDMAEDWFLAPQQS